MFTFGAVGGHYWFVACVLCFDCGASGVCVSRRKPKSSIYKDPPTRCQGVRRLVISCGCCHIDIVPKFWGLAARSTMLCLGGSLCGRFVFVLGVVKHVLLISINHSLRVAAGRSKSQSGTESYVCKFKEVLAAPVGLTRLPNNHHVHSGGIEFSPDPRSFCWAPCAQCAIWRPGCRK